MRREIIDPKNEKTDEELQALIKAQSSIIAKARAKPNEPVSKVVNGLHVLLTQEEIDEIKNTQTQVIIPNNVTPVQFRKALKELNLFDRMEAVEDDEWEYGLSFSRDSKLLESIFSEEELDEIFRLAATL